MPKKSKSQGKPGRRKCDYPHNMTPELRAEVEAFNKKLVAGGEAFYRRLQDAENSFVGDSIQQHTDETEREWRVRHELRLATRLTADEFDKLPVNEVIPMLRAAAAMKGKTESPNAKDPAWKRLTIIKSDTGDDLARLDGMEFRLTSAKAADFLSLLKTNEGKLLGCKALESNCGRPARIYEGLPVELKRIIDKPERGTGKKGYRML